MEVLNPIYMAPNNNDKKTKILNIHFALSDETWRADKMFPFAKQDSEWGSKNEPKHN